MPEAVFHQMMMLKAMQAGISGYARLQGEAGRQLLQINLRGLQGGGMRAFWYAGDGLVRELGRSDANPRGEAGLYTELPCEAVAPGRLTALLLTGDGDSPRPLAIGLCTTQSAGSLLDAKSALLALCEKLSRAEGGEKHAPRAAGEQDGKGVHTAEPKASAGADAVKPAPAPVAATDRTARTDTPVQNRHAAKGGSGCPGRTAAGWEERRSGSGEAAAARFSRREAQPPREVFLPAIDTRRERRRSRREAGLPEGGSGAALESRQSCCGMEEGWAAGGSHACAAKENGNSAAMESRQPCCGKEEGLTTGGNDAPTEERSIPAAVISPGTPGNTCEQAAPIAAPPPEPVRTARSPSARPADRLPRLCWPAPFQSLAVCFDRCIPQRLMDWPGWRFVQAQQGGHALWIGCQRSGSGILRVAYALPAGAPVPAGKPFRRAFNAAGEEMQVLVMKA